MRYWILAVVLVGGLIGFAGTVHYGAKGIRNAQSHTAEFPGTKVLANDTSAIKGAPLSSVVVTQCNGLLAVYLTMPSGELVRFDKDSGLAWEVLLRMAETAAHSERIEVSCDSLGVEGYEKKPEPVSLTFM